MHRLQLADDPDPHQQRELESRAAGLKVAQTWFAMDAIQASREMCGGAGYLSETGIVTLREDVDVFTTRCPHYGERVTFYPFISKT
jgi:acyl-CoA oxidase